MRKRTSLPPLGNQAQFRGKSVQIALIVVAVFTGAGCGASPKPEAAPGPKPLSERLIGQWLMRKDHRDTQYTFTKDFHYVEQYGGPGFKTGKYEESGTWEILSGDRLELTPLQSSHKIADNDVPLKKDVALMEARMNQGSWKPLPGKITFEGNNRFNEAFLDWTETYKRL